VRGGDGWGELGWGLAGEDLVEVGPAGAGGSRGGQRVAAATVRGEELRGSEDRRLDPGYAGDACDIRGHVVQVVTGDQVRGHIGVGLLGRGGAGGFHPRPD